MGCTFAHPRNGDVNPRIFKVLNVDSEGQERNPGKIEITESELILHQKGKNPILWPLRSLRRYGFDAELFSFESGRRCPTGEGIYAFQCQRAEALFNLLQECIQRAGQDDTSVPPINHNQAALHADRPVHHNTLENNNLFRPSHGVATGSSTANPSVSRSVSQHADGVVSLQAFPSVSSAHEYINTDSIQVGGDAVDHASVMLRMNSASSRRASSNSGEPRIQYAQLDIQRNSLDAALSQADGESSQATYMNVHGVEGTISKQGLNSSSNGGAGASSKVAPPMMKVSSMREEQHEY